MIVHTQVSSPFPVGTSRNTLYVDTRRVVQDEGGGGGAFFEGENTLLDVVLNDTELKTWWFNRPSRVCRLRGSVTGVLVKTPSENWVLVNNTGLVNNDFVSPLPLERKTHSNDRNLLRL